MLDLSIFNDNQKKILRFLYEHRDYHTLDEIDGSIPYTDIDALTTPQYGPAIQCISPQHRKKLYQITPQGCGIWEELQKQVADEAYQRNYDAQALDIARESNSIAKGAKKQAALANWLSALALIASIVSIIIGFWQMLVF